MPLIAWIFLPTFHNRVQYILYDFQQYSSGYFEGGFPDGARVLSLKGGLGIFADHFFTGIGYGDLWPAMENWYATYYPNIPAHDRLFPSNQFLIYACAAGFFALLIFLLVVITPFFMLKYRKRDAWICFHATSLFCFFTEMNLESQYGVFLYCFFALWFMQHEKIVRPYAPDLRGDHNQE